jgi:hypothetical protein
MNELDLLRKYRDDVPAPDGDLLERTRAQLLQAPASPVRRVARRRVIALAAAASVVAVGLVTSDVVTNNTSGADAEASKLLSAAADLAIKHPDPVIPPGQFRYVRQRSVAARDIEDQGKRHLQFTDEEQLEWWTPASGAPPWKAKYSAHLKPTFAKPADERYAKANYPGLFEPASGFFWSKCGMPSTVVSVGSPGGWTGDFGAGIPGNGCAGSWDEPTTQFLAALPRDPDALLHELAESTNSEIRDSQVFRRINSVLLTGMAPADLRAALYRAALKLSNVRAVDGVVNLDGVSGRAVSRQFDGERRDLILDPATGQFIGSRTVATKPADGFHPGDIIEWTAVTTTITKTN